MERNKRNMEISNLKSEVNENAGIKKDKQIIMKLEKIILEVVALK